MRLTALLTFGALLVAPRPAAAQTAAEQIALGDSAYAALDAPAALVLYDRAARLDSTSYEAAWKASRSGADVAVRASEPATQSAMLAESERQARRAVALQPSAPDGHFSLARALGLQVRSAGIRQRVRYANAIRDHALACLREAPRHAGCLHVLGAWNREVMQLSRAERFIARRFLGGRALSEASWRSAVSHLEAAVAAEPWRVVHRTELGAIYAAVGRVGDARRQYEEAVELPVSDYNDPVYKSAAREALRDLR